MTQPAAAVIAAAGKDEENAAGPTTRWLVNGVSTVSVRTNGAFAGTSDQYL